jgi:hypothetical protein
MIIGDELVMTDNRQTTDRQTDRQADRQTFLSRPSSIREIFFSFFAYGRERTNGVKFIPPCFARRGIIFYLPDDPKNPSK